MQFYDTDVEKIVLSTLINQPELISEFISICGVDQDIFVVDDYQRVFMSIFSIHTEGLELNNYLLKSNLKKFSNSDKLIELVDNLVEVVNLDTFRTLSSNLLELKNKRILSATLKTSLSKLSHSTADDIFSNINDVYQSGVGTGKQSWVQMDTAIVEVEDEIRQRVEGNWELISYGNKLMDMVLGGIRPGDIVTVAGRPGCGKTSLAQTIGLQVALQCHPVLLLSYETSENILAKRYISSVGNVSYAQLDRWKQHDWFDKFGSEVEKAKQKILDKPFFIDYSQPLAEEIYSKVLQFKHKYPDAKLVIVDYMQIVPSTNSQLSEYERVTLVSRLLQRVAKKLDISVMQLSQLGRSIERRDDQRPMMSDLKQSGAIEENTDIIIFIHRPGYYDTSIDPSDCELIIGKNKNGPREDIPIRFIPEKFTFEEVE